MKNIYYKIINVTTGEVLAERAKMAQDFKSRSIGLLNRTSMEPGEALIIKPCNSIHTFFMRFPIDVLFVDKKGKILKIERSLPPWRLAASLLAGYLVVEFSKDALSKSKTEPGNIIKIEMTA